MHIEILTDDFCRCQRSFFRREVASGHTLYEGGQEQQRDDTDHIHGTDGQQVAGQVKV